jgi:hypothetical protein
MKHLFNLYALSAPSGDEIETRKYMMSELKKLGARVTTDKAGNVYAVKGVCDTYPCIVAHLDEVHDYKRDGYKTYRIGDCLLGYDELTNEFVGCGADDKNGLYIALKLFASLDVIKGAFFVGEESGCIGSRQADMSFFVDARFVAQPDRRNGTDFITQIGGTDLCSEDFVADTAMYRTKYGYKVTTGLMTDVQTLKHKGLHVSCINVSCGYYEPHTDREYTRVSELNNCLALITDLFTNLNRVYKHTYVKPVFVPKDKVFSHFDDAYMPNYRNDKGDVSDYLFDDAYMPNYHNDKGDVSDYLFDRVCVDTDLGQTVHSSDLFNAAVSRYPYVSDSDILQAIYDLESALPGLTIDYDM